MIVDTLLNAGKYTWNIVEAARGCSSASCKWLETYLLYPVRDSDDLNLGVCFCQYWFIFNFSFFLEYTSGSHQNLGCLEGSLFLGGHWNSNLTPNILLKTLLASTFSLASQTLSGYSPINRYLMKHSSVKCQAHFSMRPLQDLFLHVLVALAII